MNITEFYELAQANLKIYLKSGSSSPLSSDIHYSGVHNE